VECGIVEECNGADAVEEGVAREDAECVEGRSCGGDDFGADVVRAFGCCAEGVAGAEGGCGVVGLIIDVGVCVLVYVGVGEGFGFGEDEVDIEQVNDNQDK